MDRKYWIGWVLLLLTNVACGSDHPAHSDASNDARPDVQDGGRPDGDAASDADADGATPSECSSIAIAPAPSDSLVERDIGNAIRRVVCVPFARALQDASCGCEARECEQVADECVTAVLRDVPERSFGVYLPSLEMCARDAVLAAGSCGVAGFLRCRPSIVQDVAIGEECERGESRDVFPRCAEGAGQCVAGSCEALPTIGQECSGPDCADGTCVDGRCVAFELPAQGARGAACESDWGCEAGLACTKYFEPGGECQPLPTAGAACDGEGRCAIGNRCVAGTCEAAPTTCASAEDCGDGAECEGETASVCRPYVALGEACSSDEQCGPSAACADTCVALPHAGDPCPASRCAEGAYCAAGSCQPLPGSGEACAVVFDRPGGGAHLCASGLVCRADDRCGALPDEGEPCAMGGLCADGLACGPTGCIVDPGGVEGASCTSSGDCKRTLYCAEESRECTALIAAGQPCAIDQQCQSGLSCLLDDDGPSVCGTPGPGRACSYGDDCGSGNYCATGIVGGSCHRSICESR